MESKTILLVEDEVLIAVIHKKILSKFGFNVITAGTGEKAVEVAATTPGIDLILMDINLGDGIDGTEAAERILSNKEIPLVFLSSHTEPEVVNKTEGITSYGYIVKNSGETVLIAAIKMAFRLFETKMIVQSHLSQQEVLVEILLELHKRMNQSFDDLMYYAIEASIKLTKSAFAFTGLLSEDESVMTIHAWSKDAMSVCAVDNAPMHFPIAHAGVWGECVRQRKPVIINDYDSYAGKRGYPDGHVPITNFMAVPIFDGDRITAVGAVANSVSPYEITDVRSLISLYERLWEIIRRKISEETLRESEERFKALHNASFGGIAIHDKGIILECNQGLADMTGYSADELIGMNGLLLIAEKSRDIVMSNILSGYEKPYEAYGLRKNGQEFPMRLEARNVPYKGKSVRTVEFRDITESKRYESNIIESELFKSTLLESIPMPVFYKDIEGRYQGFNQAFEKFFGTGKEELLGKSVFDINPPDLAVIYHEKDLELFKHGGVQVYESQVCNKRGETRDVIFNKAALIDSSGAVAGLIGVVNDITEAKESADQLLRNEALLQNITENMHDLVALTDMLGNFTFVGKSHKILGYEPEYLIGRNVMEFVHPEDISYVTEGFTKWLTEGQESAITEYRYRCADGTYIWLETVGRLVRDAEGNVKELIFSSRDVTERKKNEDKISLLLKEKELLLKETYHRVKNNMNTVHGLLYLQSEELSDPVSKGIIKDAALRVQKMMVIYDTLYRSGNNNQ